MKLPNSLSENFFKSLIKRNFSFALQSRVNPHFHRQQNLTLLLRGFREVCQEPSPADNSFKVLPLTLQSEIKQHQIISLIKGNLKN